MAPPRHRTGRTILAPSLVMVACLPISYFLFLQYGGRLPPVLRRLCLESLLIPI